VSQVCDDDCSPNKRIKPTAQAPHDDAGAWPRLMRTTLAILPCNPGSWWVCPAFTDDQRT